MQVTATFKPEEDSKRTTKCRTRDTHPQRNQTSKCYPAIRCLPRRGETEALLGYGVLQLFAATTSRRV